MESEVAEGNAALPGDGFPREAIVNDHRHSSMMDVGIFPCDIGGAARFVTPDTLEDLHRSGREGIRGQ